MGYHKVKIKKGKLGNFSKIKEEYRELKDAVKQDCKILIHCELADLIGSIEAYAKKHHNLTLNDLIKMHTLTKSAFKEGKR